MTAERRGHLRAPVSLVAAVETGAGEEPVVVLDLSPNGARIQTDDPPDLTHIYQLQFSVHNTHFRAQFRVVHWISAHGAYFWGCSFLDMPPDDMAELRRVVDAAAGLAITKVRDWQEILSAAQPQPDKHIVVGHTPAGHEIRLTGRDCLDIGREGVELFVRTVAGLENA